MANFDFRFEDPYPKFTLCPANFAFCLEDPYPMENFTIWSPKLYNRPLKTLQYGHYTFTMILATLYNDFMLGSLYQLPEDFYGQ